jgi:hypothetical protein
MGSIFSLFRKSDEEGHKATNVIMPFGSDKLTKVAKHFHLVV